MKITVTFDIFDYFKISFTDFAEKKTIQLQNKRWTNSHRRKTQRPGCYAIYVKDTCLYVGKSISNPGQRVLYHLRSPWSGHTVDETLRKYPETDLNLAFWLCDKLCVGILELYLIQVLKPTLNNQGKLTGNLTIQDRQTFKEIDKALTRAWEGEFVVNI